MRYDKRNGVIKILITADGVSVHPCERHSLSRAYEGGSKDKAHHRNHSPVGRWKDQRADVTVRWSPVAHQTVNSLPEPISHSRSRKVARQSGTAPMHARQRSCRWRASGELTFAYGRRQKALQHGPPPARFTSPRRTRACGIAHQHRRPDASARWAGK